MITLSLSEEEYQMLKHIYEHIFGEPSQQLDIKKIYQKIISIRERLLAEYQELAHQGNNTGLMS